jgi:hypothetical protein
LGEVQDAQAASSSLHSKLEPDSLDSKEKLAEVAVVVAGGAELIVVCGAVVSGGSVSSEPGPDPPGGGPVGRLPASDGADPEPALVCFLPVAVGTTIPPLTVARNRRAPRHLCPAREMGRFAGCSGPVR